MSLRNKGLVLAMEDDMEIETTPGELSESMVEVADGAAEVTEGADEIEELDSAIDDAHTDSETLEKIQDVMEESVEKGEGLDETSAEIAEIAIEAICARLGIKKRVMPAMESFGSSNSRLTATKIALEGIGETLKSIWEAIANAFKAMWKYVEEFYKKYFTSIGRTKNALTKIKPIVDGFGKTKTKSDDIENDSLATAFGVNGKADGKSAGDVLTNHAALTAKITKGMESLKNVAKDLNKVDGTTTADFNEEASAYVSLIGSESGTLIDGSTVKLESSSSEDKAFNVSFEISWPSKKEGGKVATLDKPAMQKLVSQLEGLLKLSEEQQKDLKILKAISDEVINISKSQAKLAEKIASAEGEKKADIVANSKRSANSAKNLKTLFNKAAVQIPSLNVKAIQKGITYIEVSMKNYE